MIRSRVHIALILVVVLLHAGCTDPVADQTEVGATAEQVQPVETRRTRGPFECAVVAHTESISVGRRLVLTMQCAAPLEWSVEMPNVSATIGEWVVRSRHEPANVPDDSMHTWTWTYEVDTFATGIVEIPSMTFSYTTNDGVQDSLETESLTIVVHSVLDPDETIADLRGVKPMFDIEMPDDDASIAWWWWCIGGAFIIGCVVLAMRWRQRAAAITDIDIQPLPWEWAREELAALSQQSLLEQGAFETFYVRLSDIVRGYLERRFSMRAPDRTTDEFLVEARRDTRLSDAHKVSLEHFMRAADLVKFARLEPNVDDGIDALGAASSFVEQTAHRTWDLDGPEDVEVVR